LPNSSPRGTKRVSSINFSNEKRLLIKIFPPPIIPLLLWCGLKKVHGKKKESKFNENMRRDTGRRKISGNESSEKKRLPATG
jgi:hypothetical protein